MLLFLPPNYNKPLSYYYSALFRLKNTIVLQNQFLMPGHEVERSDFVRFMREKNITKAYFLHYYLFESGQVRDFYLHRLGLIFNVKRDKDFKDINLYEMDLRADAK